MTKEKHRGKRKLWLRVVAIFLALSIAAFCALEGIIYFGGKTRIEQPPDVMLVLGCQVKSWGPSILLQDRLDAALGYLQENPDLPVVVSGGQGKDEPTTEAQAMYDYLTENGIKPERIYQEGESHNTSQNLVYSKALLEDLGYDLDQTHILIVSNDFHLTRAGMLAQRYGLDVSVLAAPVTHAPSEAKMFFREPLALVKSFLFD